MSMQRGILITLFDLNGETRNASPQVAQHSVITYVRTKLIWANTNHNVSVAIVVRSIFVCHVYWRRKAGIRNSKHVNALKATFLLFSIWSTVTVCVSSVRVYNVKKKMFLRKNWINYPRSNVNTAFKSNTITRENWILTY